MLIAAGVFAVIIFARNPAADHAIEVTQSWAILCLCVAMDQTAALFADMPKRVKGNRGIPAT